MGTDFIDFIRRALEHLLEAIGECNFYFKRFTIAKKQSTNATLPGHGRDRGKSRGAAGGALPAGSPGKRPRLAARPGWGWPSPRVRQERRGRSGTSSLFSPASLGASLGAPCGSGRRGGRLGFGPTRRIPEMAKYTRGTVTAFAPFDARADAEALRKAMKGLGTDEETVLTILTTRNNAQRQEIASAFKTLFGRDLVDDLKSELTGKLETLMVSLMRPAHIFDAHALKHAIKGAGTNEKVLTEILASRTPAEVQNIKQVYQQEYEADLEDKITGETSGHFQRLLVVLLQGNRDPDVGVDEALVEQDAQVLFRAGELKWGTDEEKFITILGTRSVSHLRRVFDKYMTISGFQIEETIDRETSGDLEKLLLAVVKCVRSVPAYFAETLYYSMKGAGTDDDTLIRVMVSRSEVDLLDIRQEFRKNFAKSLYQMIQKDTSGDYRKALLLLCGGDDD
uniref:Annexin n=2 Tax=Serinus canaria TaxID=9135 RepID=A0A8C9KYZ4_SERCA